MSSAARHCNLQLQSETVHWKAPFLTGGEFAAQAQIFLSQQARLPTLTFLFRHRRSFRMSPGFTAQVAAADLTQAHPPTISNYSVIAVDPELNPIAPAAALIPGMGQGPTSKTFYYLAQADVTLPVLKEHVTAKIRRVLQRQEMSPWNYAIFYVDPLEIHPGAPDERVWLGSYQCRPLHWA